MCTEVDSANLTESLVAPQSADYGLNQKDPPILLSGIYQREIKLCPYKKLDLNFLVSIVHKSQKVQIILMPTN